MSRFNWDDLRFFLAVARAQTVSGAGRALGVDHATVIRRLDNLETSLGAKLFQRSPRGYDLTLTGERLLVVAQSVEAETLKVTEGIGETHQAVSGTLRISSLEGIGNFFLASRLPRFKAAHPGLTIEFIAIQQLLALSRREADIAITLQPTSQGRFRSSRITDYVLYVYGSSEYLSRAPQIRHRDDLKRHEFTGYIEDLIFVRELNYLNEIGVGARPGLQSSSLHAQVEAARQGYGLCVLPRFIGAQHADLVAVCPEDIFLLRSYWLISHEDTADAPRVRAAAAFIMEEAAAARSLFMGDDNGRRTTPDGRSAPAP
jgi:DNA-binding transcriptional LysR family regulator